MNAKTVALKAKNFVVSHQLPITIVATAATTAAVTARQVGKAAKVASEFIAEKGLSEEFVEYLTDKSL